MIQRIQTLWLLSASILAVLMYFFPVIELADNNALMIYSYEKISIAGFSGLIQTGYIIAGLLGLIAFFSFIAIFLYKKRILQMRFCTIISLLDVFLVILIIVFSFNTAKNPGITIGLSAILPLIIFIFVLMARRAVRRDELLVKAADRIR